MTTAILSTIRHPDITYALTRAPAHLVLTATLHTVDVHRGTARRQEHYAHVPLEPTRDELLAAVWAVSLHLVTHELAEHLRCGEGYVRDPHPGDAGVDEYRRAVRTDGNVATMEGQ